MSTLAIGKTLLGGKYRIERVLGQGGFGITYLACHTMLDKRVAIKEFFPQSFCNRDSSTSRVVLGTLSAAELVERFRLKFIKEARNISRLSHSAIVQIHDIFEENDTAYYVMDYIEGESLSALVRREGPLASERALHLVRCVGDALSYIHGLKMNHLDVKPANIMLSQATGQPTLIDFGLAKQYDEGGHQTTSTPVGISHGYAPMEQYNIGGVSLFSPETDIYALGATLYYLLSGEIPTEAPKLINEELTFPATIPANLIAPIRRAMSPAKRDRYSSVADFLQALEAPAVSAEEPETLYDDPAVEDTVLDEEKQRPTPKPTPQSQPAPQPAPRSAAVKENPITPTPKKKGSKKWLWTVVILLLVAGGFWGGRSAMTHLREQQAIADSIALAEAERAAFVQDSTEKANAAAEKAEKERLAKEKAAEEKRLAEEKAAKEKAERERLAAEQAAKEKAEKERREREAREAAEKAEHERLAAEQAAKEKAEQERREREAREAAEKAERERLAREAANKTYKVGDYYNVNGKEGVVFYVDASGKHGKIVSMTQSNILQWSLTECEQRIGASSKTNGAANMRVVQQRPNWRENYPAFAWCADLGKGWYLPALNELLLLISNKRVHDIVNQTLSIKGGIKLLNVNRDGSRHAYWSSTENGAMDSYASGVELRWGLQIDRRKGYCYPSDGNYVRAVSDF